MKVINRWKMSFSKHMDNKVEKNYSVLTFKRSPEEILACLADFLNVLYIDLYSGEINIFANTLKYLFCHFISHPSKHRTTLMLPSFPTESESAQDSEEKKHQQVPANNACFPFVSIIQPFERSKDEIRLGFLCCRIFLFFPSIIKALVVHNLDRKHIGPKNQLKNDIKEMKWLSTVFVCSLGNGTHLCDSEVLSSMMPTCPLASEVDI